MTYNQEWDRILNPYRYDSEGNLTDEAKQQDVRMQLDSADGGGGRGSADLSVNTETLKTIGHHAHTLYGRLSDDGSFAYVTSFDAAISLTNDGFQTGSALTQVVDTWGTQVNTLTQACAHISNSLAAISKDHSANEHQITTDMSMSEIGKGFN